MGLVMTNERAEAIKELVARFHEICGQYITRDGCPDLIAWIERSDYYTAPASTRFHGCYPGGLLEHSLNVYDQLVKLIHVYYEPEDITPELMESAAIVALFHDLCKVNFYEPFMKNVKNNETGRWEQVQSYRINEKVPLGHSQKSVIILQQFMKLKLDEIYAVMGHMGFSDSSFKGGDSYVGTILDKSKLALLTHIADMLASKLMESELPPEERSVDSSGPSK